MNERRFAPRAILLAALLVPAASAASADEEVHASGAEAIALSPPASGNSQALGSAPSTTRMLTVLALVTGAVLVVLPLGRRWMTAKQEGGHPTAIRVLARASLDPRTAIYLVRCGPRVLILGGTATNLNTLAEIADPQEIDEYMELSGGAHAVRHAAGGALSFGGWRAVRERIHPQGS